jgi:hypothetical protein
MMAQESNAHALRSWLPIWVRLPSNTLRQSGLTRTAAQCHNRTHALQQNTLATCSVDGHSETQRLSSFRLIASSQRVV